MGKEAEKALIAMAAELVQLRGILQRMLEVLGDLRATAQAGQPVKSLPVSNPNVT